MYVLWFVCVRACVCVHEGMCVCPHTSLVHINSLQLVTFAYMMRIYRHQETS